VGNVRKAWLVNVSRVALVLANVGCSNRSCNKSPHPVGPPHDAGQNLTLEKIKINTPNNHESVPLWLAALRERRWSDAVSELSASNQNAPSDPKMRLALAYALAKDEKFNQALPLLTDLEKDLPLLRAPIARLRAELSVHTAQAVNGAAWLATQGELQGYVQAAQTYAQAQQYELALACAKRAIDLLTPRREDASRAALARARVIRARVLQARGDQVLAAQDWLWLALQAPLQPAAAGADELWEKATSQKLNSEQRLLRAGAFARAGMLEATERELELLQTISHTPMTPGYSDWLLGKARSKARVDHAEGAHLLERSIVARVEDADSLRLEAARLYLRAGQESQCLRILEALLKAKSPRSREAQALAARVRGIVGDYGAALRHYDSLLGKDGPKGKDDLFFEQAIIAILAGQPSRAVTALDTLAQNERRETMRARTAELAAVAVLEAKRKDDAIARFRAVITQYPFTLGAWLASERLKQLQITDVPSPVPTSAPQLPREITLDFPKNVAILHEIGLVDLAVKALIDEEPPLRSRYGMSAGEIFCDAYGVLGTGDRRYAWSREAVGNLDLTKLPDPDSRWRWDCRYPRPYQTIVTALEKQWQLPAGLVHAVMRQESGFREKVQSPVGATGLTQLMPSTARHVLKNFGDIPQCATSESPALDEPRCNIELGARYLHKLLNAFDGQLALAVLSYNAGPQVVTRWASGKNRLPLDLFLALVPFAETRNYVHYVVTNFLVYTWLGQPGEALPTLNWQPTASNLDFADLY